jgi:hypothetical protein
MEQDEEDIIISLVKMRRMVLRRRVPSPRIAVHRSTYRAKL